MEEGRREGRGKGKEREGEGERREEGKRRGGEGKGGRGRGGEGPKVERRKRCSERMPLSHAVIAVPQGGPCTCPTRVCLRWQPSWSPGESSAHQGAPGGEPCLLLGPCQSPSV